MNNAGFMVTGKIDTCTVQHVDLMFSVHVRSVFMIIKRAMPHLKMSKGKCCLTQTSGFSDQDHGIHSHHNDIVNINYSFAELSV